jgi:hypothetical protein
VRILWGLGEVTAASAAGWAAHAERVDEAARLALPPLAAAAFAAVLGAPSVAALLAGPFAHGGTPA